MSFICKNGPEHRHDTAEQSKVCWGVIRPTAPSAPARTLPGTYGTGDRATDSQVAYVEMLGGDAILARSISKSECSRYIDRLKKEGRKPVNPVSAGSLHGPPAPVDPKVTLVVELIKNVPDGRFAVRPDESRPYTFLRVSRPKNGNFKGATKVQTQHGPSLSQEKFVVWPSGKVSVYEHSIIETLMLTVADYRGAARAYARELNRCCRCNTELTDDNSRHYGIGPECVKHWPWIIEMVDAEDAEKS